VNAEVPAFLIVDDNQPLRDILVRVIRKAAPHAVIEEVASVRAALHALHARSFAIVIVDHRLPDGDGAEVIRWVRARTLPVSIIATSGLNVEQEMLAVGADYVLRKPFPLERLLTIVRTLTESIV
jgi:DNA-binding response OmpR family regulator